MGKAHEGHVLGNGMFDPAQRLALLVRASGIPALGGLVKDRPGQRERRAGVGGSACISHRVQRTIFGELNEAAARHSSG